MTDRSIAIERRAIERIFTLSDPLDCDEGSLNRDGVSDVRITDEDTEDLLVQFIDAIPALYRMRVYGPKTFGFKLIGGENWNDVEFSVVTEFAKSLHWELGSFTVDDAPMERVGELRTY